MSKIKVGLVGSGFVADLHAAAFRMVPDADIVAVASLPGLAKEFAAERGYSLPASASGWHPRDRSPGGA